MHPSVSVFHSTMETGMFQHLIQELDFLAKQDMPQSWCLKSKATQFNLYCLNCGVACSETKCYGVCHLFSYPAAGQTKGQDSPLHTHTYTHTHTQTHTHTIV